MKKFLVSLLAMALAFSQPVFAQQAPTSGPASILSGQVTLAVSSVNARVALPSTAASANTVTIYNKGTVDAYVALGDVTATATSGGTCVSGALGPSCQVPAGASLTLWRSDATYVAAITASSTTNLVVYQGTGPMDFKSQGTGTISGTVTATLSGAIPAGTNTIGSTTGIYKNVSVIPTVQNAAYSAGQAIGGLQSLTVLSSGLIQQVQLASKGGSTVGVWVYLWNKNPAASTCTDRNNFVTSQADNQNLIAVPFLLTPALGVSANDVTTYAQQANMAAPFVNNDTSPGTTVYACLLAAAAVTPATTTDYRLNVQAAQ